jgi:hypothetical protein
MKANKSIPSEESLMAWAGELEETAIECYRIHKDSTDKTTSLSLWYDILKDFTSRSLTLDGDRLPAISGIARQTLPTESPPPPRDDTPAHMFCYNQFQWELIMSGN